MGALDFHRESLAPVIHILAGVITHCNPIPLNTGNARALL